MHLLNIVTISLAIWLGFCFVQGSAIQCFHCNSFLNGECGDPFEPSGFGNDSSLLVDCNELGAKDGNNYTFCRKTTQTATLLPDKDTVRIIRSCAHMDDHRLQMQEGDDPSQMKCYRRTGTYSVELLFCGCYTDGCNSGNLAVAGIGSVLFSIFVAFLGTIAQK